MAVYNNNLVINSGADYSHEFILEKTDRSPVNLAGYAISSYIRKHPESSNIVAKFNPEIKDSENGIIQLSLGSSITSSIKGGRYVYDVLIISSSNRRSIALEGTILVRSE